ncbi:hypothetical protein [Sedimenticola hydrogenitrophicus]|uniref:hypothetical protein n=1 Tax=Sedimenticola hydrogenitrophicus TaxID=2967975 RepID=UPI0023AEEF0F|nr:hypothetical protein [Sedimenticola hydrogenitrophicus]
METYNPDKEIDAAAWLWLDENERIELVQQFHLLSDQDLPEDKIRLHSAIHVVVENQLAMGVEPVPETIARLIRQGLDRHEAIHAIGAIIAGDIFDILKGNVQEYSLVKYRRKLEKITAKRWRKGQY